MPALTWANGERYAHPYGHPGHARWRVPLLPPVVITLNGERFELDRPITVAGLLDRLEIDSRRVAVEQNLEIIRRQTYADVVLDEGDTVEIVNFVGGG